MANTLTHIMQMSASATGQTLLFLLQGQMQKPVLLDSGMPGLIGIVKVGNMIEKLVWDTSAGSKV
jgi:hypothetical protein